MSVVAQDGSGDYASIQAALDAIPADNASLRVVLVRNGIYREKLYIRAGHLAIVGEDREKTRIVFAELRRLWRAEHGSDWGAAVVNIGERVTDLVIGNLTVHNNYGSLHGDHDHQFAIRSGSAATRITLLSGNFIADGGDTVSLWNAAAGMYYHADCDFEGWVDYVCPRGWCYITHSRFFGHDMTASIWHDGSQDEDAKLVIRRSHFDGEPGFPLGRNNRDGQFYLLDNLFSSRMADRPIYLPSPRDTYRWGERYYYSNNHREGGDYAWFADNLSRAPGAPRGDDVTARWTFAERWDPEETLPAVLPFASVPRPETGVSGVPAAGTTLRWIAARDAHAHRVHLGTTASPALRAERRDTRFPTGRLEPNRTYFWRVDAVTASGIVRGPTWQFTTAQASLPTPSGPSASAARATRQQHGAAGGNGDARAAARPIRIVLVGDSTVTDDSGWGRGFKARLLPGVECVNLAQNGRSSKSYRDEGFWEQALKERPDYVLIQFGHNDQPGKGPERETDPKTTYRENLARYVDQARAVNALPVIVTSLTRRRFNAQGRIESDLLEYVQAAKDVALDKNIPLVDLHAASIELLDRLGAARASAFDPKKADGTPDRTHLTPEGSDAFGRIVAARLREAVARLADVISG